jgi:hypothetical protein
MRKRVLSVRFIEEKQSGSGILEVLALLRKANCFSKLLNIAFEMP